MSGLSLSLNNALSGLNVNQSALAALSQNIANANTAGYSRQYVQQESLFLDDSGLGVGIKQITRKVDEFLIGAVRTQTSQVGMSDVTNDYHDRVQLLLGQPGSNNSISAFIDTFFNGLQSLAQTPENTTLQRLAVDSGNNFARQVQQLANGLQDLQYQADKDITDAIRNVNSALAQIHELNGAIVTAGSLGKSPADLMDKRDILLNDVAQYLDIKTFTRDNGAINIISGTGISLLDENLYALNYTPVGSAQAFANDALLSPITLARVAQGSVSAGEPVTLVTSGRSDQVVSTLTSGKIRALVDVRDRQIPEIMQQLDVLASTLRDQFNAIHNSGSGYPGGNTLTGTRLVSALDANQWTGDLRIGVLNANGQPIPSPYANQPGGVPALNIDLSSLNSGYGNGKPSVQTIIDEINQYYGVPQNKVSLGNLDNIRLTSNVKTLPGTPPAFVFDFDLSNRAAAGSTFFVTGATLLDDQGNTMATPTSTVPSVNLASTATYVTTAGSRTVVVNTATPHGLINGQKVYLSTPGSPSTIDGIPATSLGGYFTVSNVTSTGFEISVAEAASAGASTNVASQTVLPPYAQVGAGEDMRTGSNGLITADLTGNTLSQYYTIRVNVAVDDGNGNISMSEISYRITSNTTNLLNDRYAANNIVSGSATIVPPSSLQPIAQAMLVDANGKELPKIAGAYTSLERGYLVIKATNSSYSVVVDSLDSKDMGNLTTNPQVGSNRSFSHYFELNNFFKSNVSTATGDTVRGSALNMEVESRILSNPALISLGSLSANPAPLDPSLPPSYTYSREKGDNSIIQRLAAAGLSLFTFTGAGGLADSTQSFGSYAGVIIGTAAQKNASTQIAYDNAQTLLDGFQSRASSISGVNLDTELANTVIYQNAYAASARIITVTNTLFDSLLESFR